MKGQRDVEAKLRSGFASAIQDAFGWPHDAAHYELAEAAALELWQLAGPNVMSWATQTPPTPKMEPR